MAPSTPTAVASEGAWASRGGEWDCWAESTAKARKGSDVSARRLENACWRLWNMEKSAKEQQGSPTPGESSSMPKIRSSHSLQQVFNASSDEGSQSDDNLDPLRIDDAAFKERLEDAIGGCIDFAYCRFPAKQANLKYDDLPTFPIRPNFASFRNSLRPASECVVFDGCPEDPYHPSNTPIYQTATFVQPSCSEFGAYDYTRSGNPTRTALEKHVALLEQAAAAFAFASGMAALHTVMRLLRCGDEILVNEDIYGGMHRLLTQDCVNSGIKVTFVDTTDIAAVKKAITPQTKLIHVESPSNPRMKITDLKELATTAHRRGVLLSVDSTMMPPVICKPLTLGADIVIHSATKFFSGHADCTGGLVCVRDPTLAHRVAFLQNAEGTALAPFECFLFLRGIKTMHLRVERAQANAERVGAFLLAHPHVKEAYFPGRGGCDSMSLVVHRSQATGQGSMISLTTGCVDFSRRFCDACKIFKTTVSFGSVNSLIEMPCTMSHASIPAEKRTLPDDLVRLSVGIEDVEDLVADLAQALEAAAGGLAAPCTKGGYDSRFEDLPVVPNPGLPGPRDDSPSKSRDAGSEVDARRLAERLVVA
eukprot:CAMPEP_0176044176 /NCGR_PEP_ID=MMETSP0120_2-20121206/21925_1 /TAXON_ID=160619 /ORGANISM="Kryptoperidinium foliaceum, Strain CCMP 1326" /LENGTH=591 /DNA_ID=CAMNT_0017377583 /DNA_START=84 /DNA_END=1855 /DNA_ORIENTATION=+